MVYLLIFVLLIVAGYLFFTQTGSRLTSDTKRHVAEVLDEPLPELINGTTGYAESDGIKIFFESINRNEDGAQESILLICGHTQTILDWPPAYINTLVSKGHHVVRFDNRGVGMSDWMSDWSSKGNYYLLSHMAEDALAVLDKLQIDKVHIVGMSMGGMIGQHLAIEHKERIMSLTSIMSTGHYYDRELPNVPMAFQREFLRLGLGYFHKLSKLENKMKLHLEVRYALDGKGDYQLNQKVVLQKALYELKNRRGYNMKATQQHSFAIKKSPARYEGLRKLRIPVLVVHGTTDPLVKFEHAKKYAPLIPKARKLFIEGMGHDLPEVHREEITTAIDSLVSEAMTWR